MRASVIVPFLPIGGGACGRAARSLLLQILSAARGVHRREDNYRVKTLFLGPAVL